MFNALRPVHKGILLALLGYSCFSVADMSAKILTGTYPVFQIIFMETVISSILLILLAFFQGSLRETLRPARRGLHILRGVLNFVIMAAITFGLKFLPIADVYTIVFCMPFLASLLARVLYGQIVSLSAWGAIAIGFSGVVLAFHPGQSGWNAALLLPLGAAFAIALMFVISRSLQDKSVLPAGFWPAIISAGFSLAFAWGDMVIPRLEHLPLFLLQGATVALALVAIAQAFRLAPASLVSPIMYTQMIWGVVFGALLFGDAPTAAMMVSAALIIASGLAVTYLGTRQEVTATQGRAPGEAA